METPWKYDAIHEGNRFDPFANVPPSQITLMPWLWAKMSPTTYPVPIMSGKWLIFAPVTQIDRIWGQIKQTLFTGQLGSTAKVATMYSNPHATISTDKVICVYTYNAEDVSDVRRIRAALRTLGIDRKIPYKTDEATYQGKYQKTGATKISKYYE